MSRKLKKIEKNIMSCKKSYFFLAEPLLYMFSDFFEVYNFSVAQNFKF